MNIIRHITKENNMRNLKHLSDIIKFCSVLPALIVCAASAESVELKPISSRTKLSIRTYKYSYNVADGLNNNLDGAVFWASDATLNIDNSIFKNNSSNGKGATLYMKSPTKAFITDTDFNSNTAVKEGGAIYSSGKELTLNNVNFNGNTGLDGGAVFAGGTNTITGGSFVNNKAIGANVSSGGAIYLAAGKTYQLNIDGTLFENNSATGAGGAMALFAKSDIKNATIRGNTATQGGGLFLGSESHTTLDNVIFDGNSATETGGAIKTRIAAEGDTSLSSMTITNGEFNNNSAQYGGAIHNSMTGENAFSVSGTSFAGNKASEYGGAIYNSGKMTIDGSQFTGNHAYIGGAFFVAAGSDTTINNSIFRDNTADYGGAGYTSVKMQSLTVNNSSFINNSGLGVGGLGIFAKAELNNVLFSGNRLTVDEDGGAALFLGAESQTKINDGQFNSNSSATVGGAISMRAANVANNSAAKLDIVNSSFHRNTAGAKGGAIYSTFYNSEKNENNVSIEKTRFMYNSADLGGAIYNDGAPDRGGNLASMMLSDVTFTGNSAKTNGGAIYNAAGATVALAGNNTFSGNTIGGGSTQDKDGKLVANDIHNLGTLNILSGETTFASGVSGDGVMNISDGATMNIGTAKIEQGTLNIDGIVTASVFDKRSYGRLYADNYNIGENGTLKLNVGSVGTYQIFNGDARGLKVDAGGAYIVTNNADGNVVIATKAIDDLAADTGLSTKAAGTVAGLANTSDRTLAALSLKVQHALSDGNIDSVEHELGKANPVEKPVAHSVATSVQNQVLNMVQNRMAGLTVGRNGGDVTAEYGFWAHGLYNKSKYGAQFHGYTRGVAAGFDTLINRAWTVGVGYAWNSTDLHAHDRATDIDSGTVFMYGQYKPRAWYVNGALNYTKSEYKENFDMFGLSFMSEHDVKTFGGQLMTGYDFRVGLTPEVGIRYLHMNQDDYNNGLADVKGRDSDFLTGVAGMKYSFLIHDTGRTQWRPELRAAATYDMISDDTYVTVTMPGAAAYIVDGDRLSRFGGEFGLGLSAQYQGLTVTLSYDLDLHENYTSQTGMAKFKLMF